MNLNKTITVSDIADCVDRFRTRRPHIHCITNMVAQHFTANVVLAAGGTPSMTISPEEIADFVTIADALLINLGTMDNERREATLIAIETAKRQEKPFVLDPVFVQASPLRLAMAHNVLRHSPTVIRCNAAEAASLFMRKIDIADLPSIAKEHDCVLALTGKRDLVADARFVVNLSNGSTVMDRITAMGCALTALIAGMCAVEKNTQLATSAAITLFGLAGQKAELNSQGPGTFVAPFLDALASLTAVEIEEGARIDVPM